MDVDVHTHYLPRQFLDLATELGDDRVGVETRDGRQFVGHPKDTFPLFDGFTDLEARIEWMDEHGVDVGLLSVSKPSPNDDVFSPEESIQLVRALNDGYAAARDAYPDRIAGLGALPLHDTEAALDELNRIRTDLDLSGVCMHTRVRGQKLSDLDVEPVFEAIDRYDMGVFMHPSYNSLSTDLGQDEWIINPLVMFPTETTFQIARLVFDGFFDRHDFDLVLAHLGGALPFLAGRLELGRTIGAQRFDDGAFSTPERPVAEYLSEFYYDAIIHHPPALACAVETVGTDRLVFGTDYPFESEDTDDVRSNIASLDLSDSGERAVLGSTAAAIFDL